MCEIMNMLICRGFQHRNRFSMRIGRKPAGHDPALMTKAVFPFVRSERQGALANAEVGRTQETLTGCMVQFLKAGDWLQCEVRGLSRDSIAFPQGAGTPFLPFGGVGGGFWLENKEKNLRQREGTT